MSGQTYTTTIRVPTPQELAAQVIAEARNQGTAAASGFTGAQALAGAAGLRASALRYVVDALAPIAKPIPGSAASEGTTSARVELGVRGVRVPVRIEVDPATPGEGCVTFSMAHAHGLSCAQETRVFAEIAALLAGAGGPEPAGPSGAGATSPAVREQRA